MLRQNGLVSGTEIAELLVGDYETLEPTPSVLCSRPTCDGDADLSSRSSGVCTGSSLDEDIVVCDGSQLGTTTTSHVVAKFREYLLFGRKKCALEWATKHGLWGHALSLASRMDTKTHAAMMTRFTNALSLNDPLRTLYQQLSGRQPAAAPLVATMKWGDWRPHLAMILSNASASPEADARNVTILGDALARHGCLAAAHFCYLVAHVEFGSYSRKSSKLVLLGADHRTLPFRRFASNEAIHCTEIYEYARSLSDSSFMLPHLQEYKFLHATRLAEYGFLEEALRYCEVLAVAMAQDCVSVQVAAQTFELANRLKHHVPQLTLEQTELRKIDEAPWLDALARITSKHFRVTENKVVPQAEDNGTLQNDTESEEIRLMAEILSSDSGFQSHPIFTRGSDFFACDEDDYALRQPEEYFSSYMDTSACKDVSPPVEQQSPFTKECSAIDASQIPMSDVLSYHETHRQTVECSESSLPHLSTVAQPPDEGHFAATCSLSPESHVEVEDKSPLEDSPPPSPSPPGTDPARFDYYSASIHSQRPVTSTSQDYISGVSSSTCPVTTHVQSGHSPSASEPARPATERSREAARKSWLGAIFEKLTPKQPNQIILPDDTDPCIVWDEERKCWVDKNAPPGKTDGLVAPPPTDSSFGGQQNPYSNRQGQSRYHLSKQRSLRRRYVDLLNADSSKASGDSSLMSAAVFDDQPATTQGAPQFFVPQPTSQLCGDSSCDFVSCAPALDQTSTPPPSLSGASAHCYWPSPTPASTPTMFSPTSPVADAI
uniref:Protein transport protein Sec16A n=1 Tax=Rhipicephalus appendiculatus TaxID=34631 RepID=A0A131YY82_RHIAP